MNAWKTIGVAVALVVAVGWTCSALAQGPGETVQREGPTLQAEAAHEQAEAAGPNPLVFDPDLAVYSAIVFLLLLWVLGKYAWPPISAALDARERKIADNIESAAAKHEEAKRLLEEHETRLAAAAGEVRDLLEEARRDAEATKGRIVAEARKAADQQRDRAIREIEAAKGSAMQDLAVTSAHLAIDLARKVVRQEITADRQSQLVRDALGKLAAAKPSEN
jgi:F-type H+-transporting ATPase subunit b